MAAFHQKCGDRVILTNNNKTAVRNFSEFNHGIVLSNEPLKDNHLFQVKIEKAINSWSGSIQIGVISCDPDGIDLPASASEFKQDCWILSGTSVLQNGQTSGDEPYGADLDKLKEGDVVGVMKTDKGELNFFINGEIQGIAATNIPDKVYAIVDLYGKCAQVSIVSFTVQGTEDNGLTLDTRLEESQNQITDLVGNLSLNMNISNPSSSPTSIINDRLRFHPRCGMLVKLSCNSRTAERRKPLDEFNNGVVMTHRPLRDDELFEIRIDRLVDKWSGSIEVGVTTHNPNKLEFPATMTNMRSGTTIMSGCGILTNGKGTRREYGEFNLDELREGDRIGMMRKSNGNLHYFINGLDQDVAAANVPETVWGVVDLYGMTVKVTIVDRDEREEQNLMVRRNLELKEGQAIQRITNPSNDESNDRLTFHPKCGSHAAVINNGRTVHRPNAMDDFNNGVALTNRPLKPNELFEIRLDKMVTKWAGSIEIGVTTHNPNVLEYPSTMTNVRSGTWMMTGNGVMHNGSTIVDEYGDNLDRLKVGDRVGASRRECGSLHFYVNGIDQGVAAVNVPECVYGVIDLYGQAAQATIVDILDYSPDTDNSSLSNTTLYSDLRFYHLHGINARVSNNGLTASRPRTLGEFNHAIVITNRPLREGEIFEVKIETLVDRWSGSIEAGVTAIRPEEFEFPSTMTDMDRGTWMLSGSTVMKDGFTLRSGYPCDLDTLPVGTRIGMTRLEDGTLHYYINGVDQGPACDNVPTNMYGVIDLYGQCAQVSIVNSNDKISNPVTNTLIASEQIAESTKVPLKISHRLNYCCGKNIILDKCNTTAFRCKSYSHGLVFSAQPLENDEHFEVSLVKSCRQWSGCLQIGISSIPISDSFRASNLPSTISDISYETWYLSGSEVKRNNYVIKSNYCPNLEWLIIGHKVGVRRTSDGFLKFTVNGNDMGIAASNIPKKVFAVVDLFGSTTKIAVTSMRLQITTQATTESPLASYPSGKLENGDSLEILGEGLSTPTISRLDYGMESGASDAIAPLCSETSLSEAVTVSQGQADDTADHDFSLSEHHGKNIQLFNKRYSAKRIASYNQAVVISNKNLVKGHIYQVRIEEVNTEWACGFAIGVTSLSPNCIQFPVNALALKEHSWIIYKDCVFKNGRKILGGYGTHKFSFTVGTIMGILIDNESQLHIYINGYDLGVAASNLPPVCYAVFDLNGRCQQISVIRRLQESESIKTDIHIKEGHESQQEKADLEIQEKYPDQHLVELTEKAYCIMDIKRRNSKDSNKIEQKLCNSSSFNSGIQHLSSQTASCSFQSETDNFNTQIQQLTKITDFTRSQVDEESPTMSNSDTYNTELQLLSAQSNSQINLDDLNMQIQQLTTSNSGGDISGCIAQNFPHSHSQPFLNKHFKEIPKTEEKIDKDKDAESISSPIVTLVNEDELANDNVLDSNVEGLVELRFSSKNNLKSKRQAVIKQFNNSSHNFRNSQANMKKKCEYYISCSRFKNMLGLPEEFFSKEPGTCYCENCYQVCGMEGTYKMKGEPPTEYSIPMGWAKFPLRRHPCATDKIDTWQVAFYGTKPGSIRRILDHGELVLPGMLGMERTSLKSKEDDTDSSHIIFSPSIKYATSFSKFEFIDQKSNKKSEATLAFQILVQPGSYKVGPPSIDTTKDLDPRFERDTTEWVTKERGATVLSALLIKLKS